MRFDNCFLDDSICTPSRAVILCGTYNHVNGVTTLCTPLDNRWQTSPSCSRRRGIRRPSSASGICQGPEHCPTGFDDWAVLPGHGFYFNSDFIFKGPNGRRSGR